LTGKRQKRLMYRRGLDEFGSEWWAWNERMQIYIAFIRSYIQSF
jgi:hypothetical protein